jgi:50S ribosomal protein L16 3-hydroxylase
MHPLLLDGLSPAQFMHRHWQTRPLLARNAVAGAGAIVSRDELQRLATLPEVESRLILRQGRRWQLRHGPFRPADFRRLPRRNWTLLVQGVDLFLPRGRELLDAFDFIPHARLDDLMVSYAAPGGGVGPHFDSYDVFLLQGEGRRRWRVSRQRDLELVAGVPLKILSRFRPQKEWIVEAGDLLYLPPRYAHDGVALEDCLTLSVGFRAPSAQDLCARFLDFLHERLDVDETYADPGLSATRQPGRIPPTMGQTLIRMLRHLQAPRTELLRFIGEDLSTPKPQVVFRPPAHPLGKAGFSRSAAIRGVQLAAATILLYDGNAFYINGERITAAASARPWLQRLADRRRSSGGRIPAEALPLLHAWYRAGYLHPVSA